MNPISDATTRPAVAQASGRAAVSTGAAAQSVRQEGDAVSQAKDQAVVEQAPIAAGRLDKAIETANTQGAGMSPSLRFEPDTERGIVVIKVMNRETGEVIRQLPPEAVVEAAEAGEQLPALVDAVV